MKIAVGSTNPVKIMAVKLAFEAVWPEKEFDVEGVNVQSGVSDQPMSDQESIKGAKNRARRALKSLQADYGVGLEGGLHRIGKHWFDAGWMVIIDKKGREGIGASIKMPTPVKALKLVQEGKELGIVDDILFGTTNSKHGDGHFGLMTKNLITRTEGYKQGIISALARFIHPELFEG